MPDFTAKDVQALRQSSGAGMMDAKKALTENGGDAEAATKWLREKGLAKSATRDDRDNAQGTVAVATVDGVAAIAEVKCETDFVAKSDQFSSLAQEIATLAAVKSQQVASGSPFIGVDCMRAGTGCMKTQGVFETLIGKQQQLQLATQLCRMILKIDDVISPSPNQHGSTHTSPSSRAFLTRAMKVISASGSSGGNGGRSRRASSPRSRVASTAGKPLDDASRSANSMP